jgi:Protein of unknown function (DUF2950)
MTYSKLAPHKGENVSPRFSIKNVQNVSLDVAAKSLLLCCLILLVACGSTRAPESTTGEQTTFNSPEEAGQALQKAAKEYDEVTLFEVLGPHSKQILQSGDPAEDRDLLESFVAKYDRMHRWAETTDRGRILYIGADNYPFPIPLKQDSASQWYFHTKAGRDELLARRIGSNELMAIDACRGIANAEQIYFQARHDGQPAHRYTEKIISTPGKQDGLYWQVPADRPSSPLGRVDQFAQKSVLSAAAGGPTVFDGYMFRILTSQGPDAKGGAKTYLANATLQNGFAVLAVPVKFGDAGIMTFLVNREGTVYQANLGAETKKLAASMDAYDPGPDWTRTD